jgi:DNA-binding MarR family transcriptional regulator
VKLRLAGKPNELSPGELSRELMLSTAMTNRLDGLEKRGLVQRRPDPHDRRGILVGLTDRGQEVLAAAVRDQVVEEARLVSALGADEKAGNERSVAQALAPLRGVDGSGTPPPGTTRGLKREILPGINEYLAA